MDSLEKALEGVFVKSAPKIPENAKKTIVEWLPWINVILGVLSLWAAYALWQWAHIANSAVNYVNTLNSLYGTGKIVSTRLSATIWIGLVVLAVEAVLYILAFPGTKARKKSGWNLLFLAALVNIVYGVVVLFTSYGGFGTFIGSVVGSVIGLWVLFQIRDAYSGARAPSASKPTVTPPAAE